MHSWNRKAIGVTTRYFALQSYFSVEKNERAICSLIFVYNYSFRRLGENFTNEILGAIRDLIHIYNRKRMDADTQVTV